VAADKMGKSTIYQSARLLVGLNAFEPGQSHALHAHVGTDKMYYVLEGKGIFLLEGRELPRCRRAICSWFPMACSTVFP
jgi:oxalate decarboxylase/phosphoglucose isomerase-like protein (cupin superfamily)